MGRLARHLLGISPEEVRFDRRGFRDPGPPVRGHLEEVGRSFVGGYLAALEDGRAEALALRLDRTPPRYRGFAYEGAAMGLALTDFFAGMLQPRRSPRLVEFLAGPGAPHTYLVHVGAGWALARAPLAIDGLFARLHPVQRWLTLDGWGFHQGYFHPAETCRGQRLPRRLCRWAEGRGDAYALRAFDQGVGRSLWFVEGAGVEEIAAAIAAFPEPRRGDLWSGVGLACAYAGGVDRSAVERLRELAGPGRPQLAQGATFAAEARRSAGNPTEETEMACRVLCGGSAEAAAARTEQASRDLPPDRPGEPVFEIWRRRIQDRFIEEIEEEVDTCPATPAPARIGASSSATA